MPNFWSKHKTVPLAIFLLGLVITIIVWQLPAGQEFFQRIERAGFFGAFLAGILYATALTSSAATIIFLGLPDTLNPFLVAVIGGLGSALYDLTVFTVVHSQRKRHFIQRLQEKIMSRRRLPPRLLNLLGLLILASPLPDELAAGLMGFTEMTMRRFIAISFIANTAGILLIIILT